MTNALKQRLMTGATFIPPCTDYTELLDLAVSALRITKEQARREYANYSYAQWKALLLDKKAGGEK
ncbi:MAG: hypothetical protein LBC76_08245 [Treponema sp.]|jgi:hypothetical protein|nr:hypothetical protein [Treponema sp.]